MTRRPRNLSGCSDRWAVPRHGKNVLPVEWPGEFLSTPDTDRWLGVTSTGPVGIGPDSARGRRKTGDIEIGPDGHLWARALGNIQVERVICRVFWGNLSGLLSGFLGYPTHT